MTDRELLKLAAKAAGIGDGDALRLAVKLRLKITFDSLSDGAVVKVSIPYDNEWFDDGFFWSEWLNNDPYAATRRAIVRAAAEIGKQMGEE